MQAYCSPIVFWYCYLAIKLYSLSFSSMETDCSRDQYCDIIYYFYFKRYFMYSSLSFLKLFHCIYFWFISFNCYCNLLIVFQSYIFQTACFFVNLESSYSLITIVFYLFMDLILEFDQLLYVYFLFYLSYDQFKQFLLRFMLMFIIFSYFLASLAINLSPFFFSIMLELLRAKMLLTDMVELLAYFFLSLVIFIWLEVFPLDLERGRQTLLLLLLLKLAFLSFANSPLSSSV